MRPEREPGQAGRSPRDIAREMYLAVVMDRSAPWSQMGRS